MAFFFFSFLKMLDFGNKFLKLQGYSWVAIVFSLILLKLLLCTTVRDKDTLLRYAVTVLITMIDFSDENGYYIGRTDYDQLYGGLRGVNEAKHFCMTTVVKSTKVGHGRLVQRRWFRTGVQTDLKLYKFFHFSSSGTGDSWLDYKFDSEPQWCLTRLYMSNL